jgi:hypothetical protein
MQDRLCRFNSTEDIPGDRIRTESRAAFQTERIGIMIGMTEGIEIIVSRYIKPKFQLRNLGLIINATD